MALVKRWALTAASDIMTRILAKTVTTDFAVADVIERHCPFKVDAAYMPVPRCDGCRHWQPFEQEETGACRLATDPPERHFSLALGDLETRADFGCISWEAK